MQKLVLLLMANRHNNDTGMCMPSHEKLAKDCGMSKSAVKASIRSLEEKGLLSVNRRADAGVSLSNIYQLHTEVNYKVSDDGVGCQKTHPVAKKPTRAPHDIGHHTTEGGASENPGWGTTRPGVGRQKATETVNEPVIETGSETERVRTTAHNTRGTRLPADWTLPADWKEWALAEQPDWTEQYCMKVSFLFADYWKSVAGSKGVKADWQATWRNWVRRETPNAQPSAKPSRHKLASLETFQDLPTDGDGNVIF